MGDLRSTLDSASTAVPRFSADVGLSREVVIEISQQKHEPNWMLRKRLDAYERFIVAEMPTWGPLLTSLDLGAISFFVRPDTNQSRSWDDVPASIRATFEGLGIPQAEREALSGVGAQYDSDIVYHNLKEEWATQGVVFLNMDEALRTHEDLVRECFMTQCVPVHDHPFAMLHAAVWSGGTFIYVPKGVSVDIPMQAYFRMNAERGGQFEHTLIIADEGSEVHYIEGCSAPKYSTRALHAGCVEIFVKRAAKVKYSSIENWSKNTFNLNTKRALVDDDGTIEWLSGNMGSGVTMLYPMSILRGARARSSYLGVAFAGPGQVQDTGAKAALVGPETSATIRAKSLSVGGGVSTYRGLVKVTPAAKRSTVHVQCDALMLDAASCSQTIPVMSVDGADATVSHEASVGRIGDAQLAFIMSRGLTADAARRLIVGGFLEPIVADLPLEYAVELEKLIDLEMEGAIA